MAEVLLGGKRLGELKVTELKAELEKRGLRKYGVKSVLLIRLKTAILHEALLTQVSCSSVFQLLWAWPDIKVGGAHYLATYFNSELGVTLLTDRFFKGNCKPSRKKGLCV